MIRRTIAILLIAASAAFAQVAPAPAAPSAGSPAAPPSPVSGIRNKISAGDLLSAESVLEVYHEKNGEDGPWLLGLSWLARGALLLDDTAKAGAYGRRVRSLCAERMGKGAELAKDHDLEIAFGGAVEVQAQCMERRSGAEHAAAYLRGELAGLKGPVPLLARLNKRLNMLELTGKQPPELVTEDYVGDRPPTLASLRGRPVVIFLWYQGCGDCKAQSASLGRVKSRYAAKGVEFLALTRYYDDTTRAAEKAAIDSVWKSVYAGMGVVPIVISTASVVRYGGSSTPTFIFLDREGIVRRYTPTRLTEEELNRTIDQLIR